MTEKRFSVDNHCNLYDNEHNVFYPVEDSRENIELLCRRLNNLIDENEQFKSTLKELKEIDDYFVYRNRELNNENEQLENENEQLKQLINEAEDIIVCQCTPYYQRIWENIKKNINGDVE